MQRLTIGVLRGGPSSEYEVSLNSGKTVLEELDTSRYAPRDIFIDRKGNWHVAGRAMLPERALRGVDVVFNALHGEYGEDGTVQRLLDTFDIPYTGSRAMPSAVAMNKHRTKELLAPLGIRMAQGVLIDPTDDEDLHDASKRIFSTFPAPWIVKPAAAGSSVAVSVVRDFPSLSAAIQKSGEVGGKVLVEEFIAGRESTVGVADHFRGEETYAFFPIEIIPPGGALCWTYEAKYDGSSQELCPGNFTDVEKKELTDTAKKVHKALNLSHYSRSDFIVSPKGIYFLEVNTLPGLTAESLLPKAVKAVGSTLSHFFTHLIELARTKRH